MKKRLFSGFIGITSILILVASCGQPGGKSKSEGVIEYDASVVDPNNPIASMAPSKMVIKYKDGKMCAEMSAGMGLFTTSFISDPKTKSLTQLVKLLNKKFSLVQNEAAIKKENNTYPIEITLTKETKMIAGYNCMKAHVKLKNDTTAFDIFYTKDLKIENPNFSTPFYMVDGVLMEYQIKKFGLEMKFTAKSVKKQEVDESAFELPTDYKAISEKEMNEFLKSLQ